MTQPTVDDHTVVLIGGAPGVGKTTLGRGLAGRTGAASLTMDDVMIGVRAVTDPDSHPALHPIARAGGHVAYFTDRSPDALVNDAEALERATWPIVRDLVTTHRRSGPPVVIDWWLLRPRDVVTFDPTVVRSLWIRLDPDVLWERERGNADFFDASHDPEQMLANFMARSTWRNELLAAEAADLGLSVLRLDGTESPERVVELAVAAIF